MRRPGIDGGLIACFILNLALNWYGALPAAVLAIVHLVARTPLWWALVALLLWVAIVFVVTLLVSVAASGGTSTPGGTGAGPNGNVTTRYSSQRRPRR